jgi:flagellar biosynthetic protein FliQ
LDAIATSLDALYLALLLLSPVLAVAFIVSLLFALIQSFSQLTEPGLNAIARALSVLVVLSLCGAWMGRELLAFTTGVYARLPELMP